MKPENDIKSKRILPIILGICAIFLVFCMVVLVAVMAIKPEENPHDSGVGITSSGSSTYIEPSKTESEENINSSGEILEKPVLNPEFTVLLLVNGENPLPGDYNYGENLVTVEEAYVNGPLRQVNKEAWPYMQAMIEAARAEGIVIFIRSPYRSYETQSILFENQVKKYMSEGLDRAEAEREAEAVVARPSTSEHHTGFAADFNAAEDKFASTEAFSWLKENAENYGFIMRYPEDKQSVTGVIYEPWHWRFVGINAAKEIKGLNMCLEEYIEYLKN